MDRLTKDQGEFLIKEARKHLESYLEGTDHKISGSSAWLNEKCGIFVTLHTYPKNDLRGCIGFTEPIYSLRKAITEAASSAAVHDSRFPEVTRDEMDHLIIEISILTAPVLIPHASPKELLEKITQKKDGLVLKNGADHGLFLPQVWEQLPEKIEFLENLCYKAGISDKDAWQYKDTGIYKFQVQIFKEDAPGGKISEVKD